MQFKFVFISIVMVVIFASTTSYPLSDMLAGYVSLQSECLKEPVQSQRIKCLNIADELLRSEQEKQLERQRALAIPSSKSKNKRATVANVQLETEGQ